ncbi:hypothetical protein C9439_07340, partial [archaeon SCG-AAA382B04]
VHAPYLNQRFRGVFLTIKDKYTKKIEKAIKALGETLDLADKVKKIVRLRRGLEIKKIKKDQTKELLENAINENKDQANSKNVEIIKEIETAEVTADTFLEDVIHNLIQNSLIHANCDTIQIKSKKLDDEFKITVEDDGKGIPDADKERIFDIEYSAKPSSGGFGLYLIKKVIENYNGRIEVKNSDLGGARFDIFLKTIKE